MTHERALRSNEPLKKLKLVFFSQISLSKDPSQALDGPLNPGMDPLVPKTDLCRPAKNPPKPVNSLFSLNFGSERVHYFIDRTKMGHRIGETVKISPLSPPPP